MGHIRNTISDLERVVYDLAEAGALDAAHAILYPRPIGRLARAGLLRRREDGSYEAVRAKTDTRPPRASVAPPAPASVPPPAPVDVDPMAPLVVRVPQSWIDTLDAMGPDRSQALRRVLGRALAAVSGSRLRKVGS